MARPKAPEADDQRTEAETTKIRDEAVRRALSTPPTPHKPIDKPKRSPVKAGQKKEKPAK